MTIGGHSDSEADHLMTAAGQCRTLTGLSPLRLIAFLYQNRMVPYPTTQKPHLKVGLLGNRRVC